MTTTDELTTLLHEARAKADRRVPCPKQGLYEFGPPCEFCGEEVPDEEMDGHIPDYHGTIPDPATAALRVLVYGRPATEGIPRKVVLTKGRRDESEERVGAQSAIEGLLVACAESPVVHATASCSCHGTGLVLLPRLREAIEAGEWGMAIGAIEDRLRAGNVGVAFSHDAQGEWCALLRNLDPYDPITGAYGPTRYDALVDALRRWIEEA